MRVTNYTSQRMANANHAWQEAFKRRKPMRDLLEKLIAMSTGDDTPTPSGEGDQ